MKIEVRDESGKTVMVLLGERLDAHNSDLVKGKLKEIFDSGGQDVVVDFGEVAFIDSSGLGAMVSGFKNAISRHGRLVLAGLKPQPRSMFDLTRLTRVFDIYGDTAEALDSFSRKEEP